MVATASGEKLLIGACEELDPPYDIELVFVQKITLVLRKIRKNCCHQSCTFMHQIVYSAPPDPLVVFHGPEERRGVESERSSFAPGRKRQVGSSYVRCCPLSVTGGVGIHAVEAVVACTYLRRHGLSDRRSRLRRIPQSKPADRSAYVPPRFAAAVASATDDDDGGGGRPVVAKRREFATPRRQ